ncbi:hypothetical protein ACKGJI_04325 [Sulfurospirillum sp. 1307]|jgi:hypothetical protein
MYTSLKNISALVFIVAGTIFIANQINLFLKNSQDDKAKTVIIGVIAKECQIIKRQGNNESSFASASKALDKVIGKGVNALDETTYLRILSMCYGEVPYGEKKLINK